MTAQEKQTIAKRQGVLVRAIYARKSRGWTDDEIRAGFYKRKYKARTKRALLPYEPKFGGYYTNGNQLFRALLFETIKSILQRKNFKWSWKDDLDTCFFSGTVYNSLINRGVSNAR